MSRPTGRPRAARRLLLSALLLLLASPTRSSSSPAGPLNPASPTDSEGPPQQQGPLHDTGHREPHGSPEQEKTQGPTGTPGGPQLDREPLKDPPQHGDARNKRSTDHDWNKTKSGAGRVRTGDTVLNIRGAVSDHIGDASTRARAAPARASRLDHVVIRPAAATLRPPLRAPSPPAPAPAPPPLLLVEPHARATIPCPLNHTQLTWYKDGEEMQLPLNAQGEGVWREAGVGGEAVVVSRATRADAGEWRCAGGGRAAPPVQLVIYEPARAVYLSVDGRRLDAGNTWVPARDLAPLAVRCHAEGGAPPPALTWSLVAADAALDTRPYLHAQPANHSRAGAAWSSAELVSARELHNATLRCTALQRRPAGVQAPAELSAQLQLRVTYPPSFVISRWPGFGVSLRAGGAAALRCDVDANPPARAWWAREGGAAGPPPDAPEGPAPPGAPATLRWAALAPAHAGWYRCRAEWMHQDYSSIGYFLNVNAAEPADGQGAPETAETKASEGPPAAAGPAGGAGGAGTGDVEHQRVEVALGGNVQLNCPEGSIGCWWRKSENASVGWTPAGSRHAHGVLGISTALYQEGGEYRCVGVRGGGAGAGGEVRELKRVTLRVAGGATAHALAATRDMHGWRLTCGVCGRGVRAVWLRGAGGATGGTSGGVGGAVPAELRPDLQQHCWRTELMVYDPGEVWCVASSPAGGAVAVFPPRAPAPAPARHVEATRSPAPASVPAPALALFAAALAMAALG